MEREQPPRISITFEDVLENPGLLGYVVGNEEDGYYVYGPPIEDNGKFHKLTTEPVETEPLAREILVNYLNETYAGDIKNET